MKHITGKCAHILNNSTYQQSIVQRTSLLCGLWNVGTKKRIYKFSSDIVVAIVIFSHNLEFPFIFTIHIIYDKIER